MITEYILNLEKEEFCDDFVSDEKVEFWQYEARESLVEKLKITLDEAKKYAAQRTKNRNKMWLSHNAILVSGQRGTGKTVFLRNSEEIWKKDHAKEPKRHLQDLYFVREIDPTMLINEDNFSNVVIAQIYSEVEKKLQSESCCQNSNATLDKHKSIFHKALKRLADSLGKQDDFNGLTGIDKIQQYKSGINIQTYFHEFIEAAIDILGCSALVLPIDDVDMALDRAFEVVDDVRRLLGCPYIIPIVSGDYRLYNQMTNVHFDNKSYREKSHNIKLREEGQELAKQLTNAYLTKVFPNQMRITLLPIMYITPSLTIKQDEDGKATLYNYKDYKNGLLQQFYPLCHNKEVLENWPEPESARELTQLIRAMTPSRFKEALSEDSQKSLTKDGKNIKNKLWKSYINWAEQKLNGVAFTNANSYLTLVNRDSSEPFDIQELANFNPKQQMNKELYPWANKDFYNSQIAALGITNTSSDDKLLKAIKANSNRAILDSVFDQNSYTLRSMPPLEFIDQKSFVTQDTIGKDIFGAEEVNISMFLSNKNIVAEPENINNNDQTKKTSDENDITFKIERVLFDLYTHGDVYSTMVNNYHYVFMSRAFEVIFYSFVNDSAKNKEEDILHILRKTPFYSVFNMAPTKTILNEDEDNSSLLNAPDTKPELEQNDGITSKVLSRLIQEWKLQHNDLFSGFDSKLLVSIFAYMFNKTFTALNIFKQEVFSKASFGRKYETSEHLTDFAKRFEYMLINSAYTAAIKGVAIQANVAFTGNHSTIRSVSTFNSSDRVLTRNKSRFQQEISASISNVDATTALFIKALEDHPIFKLIQKEDTDKKITIPEKIKMGNSKDDADKTVKNNVKVETISAELIREVGKYIKSRNDIPNRISNVSKFETFLKNDESALEFYKNNVSTSGKGLQSLKVMKSGRGQKVNNFIVALLNIFANN